MSDDQFTVDGIFQAKVTRKSDTIKGIYLTLEISADDYSPALAQLRAGSLLKMGWQELIDVSVQPIEIPSQRGTTLDQAFVEPVAKSGNRGDGRERPAHTKQRFADLPLSQQCAMRCEDESFREFMVDRSGILDEGVPAHVRGHCGVSSRAELNNNPGAAKEWGELERDYQNWLTSQRYADTRR